MYLYTYLVIYYNIYYSQIWIDHPLAVFPTSASQHWQLAYFTRLSRRRLGSLTKKIHVAAISHRILEENYGFTMYIGKTMEKIWKTMEKRWKIMEIDGKLWKSMENYGNRWMYDVRILPFNAWLGLNGI